MSHEYEENDGCVPIIITFIIVVGILIMTRIILDYLSACDL